MWWVSGKKTGVHVGRRPEILRFYPCLFVDEEESLGERVLETLVRSTSWHGDCYDQGL